MQLEDFPEDDEPVPEVKKSKKQSEKAGDKKKKGKKSAADDENDEDEMSDTEQHAKELEELAQLDPEFFEFMQKEEGRLLEFGKAEIAAKKEERARDAADNRESITKPLVDKWASDFVKQGSLKGLKQLIDAFRIACHLNDADEDEDSLSAKFRIVNSGAYNYVMMFSLKQLIPILERHLKKEMKEDAGGRFIPTKSPRWSKLRPFFKAYFAHLLHLLLQLAEPKMIAFVLQQLQKCIHYLAPFPNFTKRYLKRFLELWSSFNSETVRILAFLNVRQMALDIPFPFIEQCLKGVYLTYVRNSKFVNPKVQAMISFMTNCVVEMFGLDFVASYQHAFVYIRQLAIHLHGASNLKNKDQIQNIYNWQTLNSINAWVRTLAAYPKQEHLQHLLYPLAQLIEGIIALQPAPKYFPLRLQCVAMLNQLSERSGVYINSGSYLVEIFASDHLHIGGKLNTSTQKIFDARFQLKVPKKAMGSKAHQDAIYHWAIELTYQWLANNSNSIAFPELVLPMQMALKKFTKACKLSYMRRGVQQLLERMGQNSKYIQAKRSQITFSSKDVSQTTAFLASEEERAATPMYRAYTEYMKNKPKGIATEEGEDREVNWDEADDDSDEDGMDVDEDEEEAEMDEHGDMLQGLGDDFEDLENSDEDEGDDDD
jgi:nucleolar complex protein 2